MSTQIFKGIYLDRVTQIDELEQFYATHKQSILSSLPFALAEMAVHLDATQFFSFIVRTSGQKIYIGKQQQEVEEKLGIILPNKTFKRLANLVDCGGYLEMPTSWGVFGMLRRTAYTTAFRDGCSDRQLLTDYGISNKTLLHLKRSIQRQQFEPERE